MSKRRQLEIEVREWDGNSFTIEAGIDPQFEQQLTYPGNSSTSYFKTQG
jgi:hypothetical protein